MPRARIPLSTCSQHAGRRQDFLFFSTYLMVQKRCEYKRPVTSTDDRQLWEEGLKDDAAAAQKAAARAAKKQRQKMSRQDTPFLSAYLLRMTHKPFAMEASIAPCMHTLWLVIFSWRRPKHLFRSVFGNALRNVVFLNKSFQLICTRSSYV